MFNPADTSPDRVAVAKHIKQYDSTHGVAPEASAARLILHLRETYQAKSERGVAVSAPEAAAAAVDEATSTSFVAPKAQGSLVAYLQGMSRGETVQLAEEECSNPHITTTLAVANLLN